MSQRTDRSALPKRRDSRRPQIRAHGAGFGRVVTATKGGRSGGLRTANGARFDPDAAQRVAAQHLTDSKYKINPPDGKRASHWSRFREYFRPVMDDSTISALWNYYSPHYHTDEDWKRYYEGHRKAYPQGQGLWRGTKERQAWMLTSARASSHSLVSRLRSGGRTRGPRPVHVNRSRRASSSRAAPSDSSGSSGGSDDPPSPPLIQAHNRRRP